MMRFRRLGPYVLVAGLVLLIYGRGLGFGLVRDDFRLLQPFALADPFSVTGNYWRPIWLAWMSLQYELFGINAHAMHRVHTALFIANLWLGYIFLRRVEIGTRIALFAVASWTLFGTSAYVVSWLSHSNDLLAMFFLLGACIVWANMFRNSRHVALYAVGASSLWVLSLMAKEVALLWPLGAIGFGALYLRAKGLLWRDVRWILAFSSPILALVLYLLLRLSHQSAVDADAINSQLEGASGLVVLAGRVIHYLEGLVYTVIPLDFFESVPALLVGGFIMMLLPGMMLLAAWRMRGSILGASMKVKAQFAGALLWITAFSIHTAVVPHPRTLLIPTFGLAMLLSLAVLRMPIGPMKAIAACLLVVYLGMHAAVGQQNLDFFAPDSQATLVSSVKYLQTEPLTADQAEYIRGQLQGYDTDALAGLPNVDKPSPWRAFVRQQFNALFN